MDNQAAYNASAAMLMAIHRRNVTGQGTEIDVPAVDTAVHLLGTILPEAGVNGRVTRGGDYPTGNRLEHPNAAPHGVYRCAGEDRWLAIAVFNDAEWRALGEAIGRPAWFDDPRFVDQPSRHAAQDHLDHHLIEWTSTQDARAAMELLQSHGVRAAVVQNAEEVCDFDPQLAHRGVCIEMDHPEIGPARFEGIPFIAERARPAHWRSAPLLGEDNRYVFTQVVGMDDAEFEHLTQEGVICLATPPPTQPPP